MKETKTTRNSRHADPDGLTTGSPPINAERSGRLHGWHHRGCWVRLGCQLPHNPS